MFALGASFGLTLMGASSLAVPGQSIVCLSASAYHSLGASPSFQGKPILGRIDSLGALLVQAEPTQMSARAPGVRSVEPNTTVQVCFTPNDPFINQQWHLAKVNAFVGWDLGRGSSATPIAIVDSGIAYNHEDLSAVYQAGGYDFVNGDNDPIDDFGHGTIVAGIASATTNNAVGVAGMGFGCKLIAVKVINAGGGGTVFNIAQGITYAVDNTNARVINVSAGTTLGSQVLADACTHAIASGVVLVGASGNNNSTAKFYPAAYPDVLSVGASKQDDSRWDQSNYGDWVSVAAPGDGIYSTNLNPTYGAISGTSVAAPVVAGLAGLAYNALGAGRSVTRANWVKSAIRAGAADVAVWTRYGRVDAKDAMRVVKSVNPLSFVWAPAGSTSGRMQTASDSSGNVYLAHRQGVDGAANVRLAKYDETGALKWQKTIDGSGHFDELAKMIVEASGNVTIAVATTAANGKVDFLVARYNAAGTQVWRKTWDGADHDDDVPTSLAQNATTTVAVGSTKRSNGRRYAFMWALNTTNGATVATKTYNLTTQYDDTALCASARTDCKFYIATSSKKTVSDFDSVVLLLSPSTNTLTKLAQYTSVSGERDTPVVLRTAKNQDAFLGGNSETKAFVTRVASGGGLSWSEDYDGQMEDLTADTSDNLYWTGSVSFSTTDQAFLVRKVSPNTGDLVWSRRIGGITDTPDTVSDTARAVLLNGGTLIVAGEANIGGTTTMLFWFNAASGQLLRAAKYASGGGNDQARSLSVSSSTRNVFVANYSTQANGVQARLLKYAP